MTDPSASLADWWPPYGTLLALWRGGRLDESAALIEEGRRDHPDAPVFDLMEGLQIVHEDRGRRLPANVVRARELVRRAVAADACNPEVLLSGAMTMYSLGDSDTAASLLESVENGEEDLDGALSHAGVHHLRALLARERGELATVVSELSRAVALDPLESEHAADLAEILIVSGELDEARRVLREALERTPGDPTLVELSHRLNVRRPALGGDGKLRFTTRAKS